MTNAPSSGFRPDVEGLRGLAVLIVVAFHSGIPGFSGGFVGVDVFFVLSGYLITGLLVAEVQKTSRLNLLQFYARRFRRLLPAAAFTLLCTLMAGAAIMAPQELMFASRAARASAVYMSNIFFAINAADYFAPDVETNPMLHTWSLGVEEQFYIFWPLLVIVCLQVWRSRKSLFAVLGSLTVLSFAASLWFTAHQRPFAFYELPARAWEFGIGGLAVLIPQSALKLSIAGRLGLEWSGLGTVLLSGLLISGTVSFPGWICLIPVMGTIAVLVGAGQSPYPRVIGLLETRVFQFLGKLSYSWYLWHWPFLVLSMAMFPSETILHKAGISCLSLGLAWVTHRLIENPIRFSPYLTRRPAFCVCLGVALSLSSLTLASLSAQFASKEAEAPEIRSITAAIDDIADMPRETCVSLGESKDVKTCNFGVLTSRTNVVLFGDSHAIQWFNPLRHVAGEHDWKLTTMLKSGCPATDISPPESTPTFVDACVTWRAAAIRQIASLRPALVVVGTAAVYFTRKGNTLSLDDWQDGTRRTLSLLAAAGVTIVQIRDTPISSFDIPTCLARSKLHSWYPAGSCTMVRASVLNPGVFDAEKKGALNLPNVHFIDATPSLCENESCSVEERGEVMYRDNNHLTGRFADSLRPVIEKELVALLQSSRTSGSLHH